MPRNPLEDIIESRRREHDSGTGRYVDLAVRVELDGERLLVAGGRWDRRLDDFDGDPEGGITVRLHPGQRAAVVWFAAWLAAHAERRERRSETNLDLDLDALDTEPAHAFAAMFAGGRRAGKTWIAVALAVCYAIMFPGAIVWLVSPSDTQDDELRRYVDGIVANEWVERANAEGVHLCNGSQLLFISAHDPEALKNGEAHLVVLNEGQRMKQRAYTLARGAIVDRSGCVLVCANPPVEAKDQQWVADFAAEADSGRRAAVYFHFNPLQNPHIDRRALLAMSAELDERTYAIEVLGEFRASADAVAYNWNRLENERSTPTDGDVTEMFLRLVDEGDGIRQLVGVDFQRIPYIGGPIYRFFGDPDRDHVLAWIVGEAVLDGGDENDFCDALLDLGLEPAETLIVGDASGRYQHTRRRTADAPPPEWKGRGSFDIIRGHRYPEGHEREGEVCGWRIVPPDRRQKRNPHIVDRLRALTSMICQGADDRRLFADPVAAPRSCAALREWKTVNGAASRTQYEAHMGDGISYPIVRLFPRRILAGLQSAKPASNPRPVNTPQQVQPITPSETLDQVGPLRVSSPMRDRAAPSRRGARGRGM